MRTLVRRFRLSAFNSSFVTYLTRSNFLNDSPTLFIENPNDDRPSTSVWYSRTDRHWCIDNTLRVSKCRLGKDGSYADSSFHTVNHTEGRGFARSIGRHVYRR